MVQAKQSIAGRKKARRRRDWGRSFARLLCVLFGLIGAIPLTGGLVLRSEPLQRWGADETSRILREQLGVEASFSVELSLIPLRLAVTNLTVPSSDGGSPAIHTELAAISPRFFSLLAGRIDVGDIELENSSVRLVIKDGKVQNVHYRFPETQGGEPPKLERSPFRSLAVTNSIIDIDFEGLHVVTGGIDIDAFAEPDLSLDLALRMQGATATHKREVAAQGDKPERVAYDEDRLCALDLRTYLSKERIIVRRLSLLAGVDKDPKEGTRPDCDNLAADEKLATRLTQVKVILKDKGIPRITGHVMTRGPAGLTNRFVDMPEIRGWAGFSGEIAFDDSMRLPEIDGEVSGENLGLARWTFAERLKGKVQLTGNAIQVPEMDVRYANGDARVEGLRIEPFTEKLPIKIAKLESHGVDFPGLMRDIGVTRNTIVGWELGDTLVTNVGGTLVPFYIDGRVEAHTHDFAVFNKAYHDPTKQRMIGIKKADIDGRFRAHSKALEFYNTQTTFGASSLPIDLVSIGFENSLIVRLKEGAVLDLEDVSPIAGVAVSGVTQLGINMEGPASHPLLDGNISVKDLMIGGFEVGDLEESKVHFEPLYVDFLEAKGRKGEMAFQIPSARLSFGGEANVDFIADFTSDSFVISEFFNIFHFDEDPRFADISGRGSTKAQVHYFLGGPSDVCKGGRLTVIGQSKMSDVALMGESFNGGEADFEFEWFDMLAGSNGVRVNIPSLALRKGTGTIFGSARIWPGSVISADFVGTRVPISRFDSFGPVVSQADGFVTATGHLGGRLDALSLEANVQVTELKAGRSTLGPSLLDVGLIPAETKAPVSGRKTGCGRDVPLPFSQDNYGKDTSDGTFVISGPLFGGQINLDHLKITRQRSKVISGKASVHKLDLGNLGGFLTAGAPTGSPLPGGQLSGEVDIKKFYVDRPFDSELSVAVTEAMIKTEDFSLGFADPKTRIVMADGLLKTEHLALSASSADGKQAILDAELSLDRHQNIQGHLKLRETDIGLFTANLSAIERAEGKLTAQIDLGGKLTAPSVLGEIRVSEGELALSSVPSPITHLELKVALDEKGLSIAQGDAKWGGGQVNLSGTASLSEGRLGRTDLGMAFRNVALPLGPDARLMFDADLNLMVPAALELVSTLPRLSGTVDVHSASYEREMNVTADIASLAARGKKSDVDNYNPDDDALEIDVLVRSSKAISLKNQMIEAEIYLDPSGLRLSGTNQRLGAVGSVEIPAGGRIYLRRNVFEVQRGVVRFNDPTRLNPEVDLTAVTDYRRYKDQDPNQNAGAGTSTSSGTNQGGNWRILMHAYGQPDNLKVDLTSDPPLSQDDIFLLLAVGLTKTELDQSSNEGVGQSVALEALGSLSGAESAVTEAVPIDEFRFGSTYSSRSGKTEPTVTIGKRLSDRIRASVTTSLSDTNEVRSNIEYRATKNLSVEGSYDNAQSSGTSTIGNMGGDVRWRLEFE